MSTGKKRKGKPSSLYTKGELNALVDATVEPLAREHPVFLVVDEICHLIIEQNPKESAVKFTRYTLPKIIRLLLNEASK